MKAVTLAILLVGLAIFGAELPSVSPRKNIIILVPDGTGFSHVTLARWFKGAPLHLDSLENSYASIPMSSSLLTGSAAAATAFASGIKTQKKALGVYPENVTVTQPGKPTPQNAWFPAASVMEAARLQGRKTGVVMTSDFRHATPAAFLTHWDHRDSKYLLAKQMMNSGVDLIMGGGSIFIDSLKSDAANFKSDIRNVDTFNKLTANDLPALVTFAENALEKEMDRDETVQPSLAEMTKKALELLSEEEKGFLLMVEGSQVDWASHDNDPVGVATELIAFDDAVAEALAFAERDTNTLILIFPDHDNGGLTINSDAAEAFMGHGGYEELTLETVIAPLKRAKHSANYTARAIENLEKRGKKQLKEIVESHLGITDVRPEEISALQDKSKKTAHTLAEMLSHRSYIGWTTHHHVGTNIPVWHQGLNGSLRFLDNTDFAKLVFSALESSGEETSQRLFVPVEDIFPKAEMVWDTVNNGDGYGSLTVKEKRNEIVFHFNTNTMTINGKETQLEGLVIYSRKRHKLFIPRQVKELL